MSQTALLHDSFHKALILSYSYSGNTQRIAQKIHFITGADWSEIHPRQPYPVTFPELLAQVRREVQSGYLPPLLPGAPSPGPYSVIFVGSPNWCTKPAPPVASWLSKNDLSGKILLPFCSHCGGAAGDLRREIQLLCPGADVREALSLIQDGGEGLEQALWSWLERTGAGSFFARTAPQHSTGL